MEEKEDDTFSCASCGCFEDLCDLFVVNKEDEGNMTFAEMFEKGFNIKIQICDFLPLRNKYFCWRCIDCLKEAIKIKSRVLNKCGFTLEDTNIKIENDAEDEYKVEFLDENILQDDASSTVSQQDLGDDDSDRSENNDDVEEDGIQTLDDTLCIYCDVQLGSEEEMQKHVRVSHGLEPRTGEPLKECPLCDVTLADFHGHMYKCHPTTEEEERLYQCHFCSNVYKTRKACFTHTRMKHGVKLHNNLPPSKTMEKSRVKCHLCERDFSQKQILNKHLAKIHNIVIQKRKAFSCPLCTERVSYGNHFSSHLLHTHGVHQEISELEFANMDEFISYKNAIQEETRYRFRKTTSSKRTVDGIRSHYMCSQSGVYIYQGKGKRPAPERQIYKTGHACPAHMIVTETTDKVQVTFYQTHVGHGPCPYYDARLPKKTKPQLYSKQSTTVNSLMLCDDDVIEMELKEEDEELSGALAWICDTCGKGFLQVEQFKTHIASHDPKLYPCQYCGSVYDDIEAWTNHIQEHTTERGIIYKSYS
ncbi:hypothetical protein O0L34_g17303 [Tuta absoluta]|nr:hypothetical protein O0L34_g17303 [Tuta absoluta]